MDRLSQVGLSRCLQEFPWSVQVLLSVDSTNSALKRMPAAPHGTVLLTGYQTGGRGRLGRTFASPEGGIYLSVLLRPRVEPSKLLHLTPMVAVAVKRAIFDCCGLQVSIKWTNDLVYKGKKLCGILTELSEGVIVGIGINCNTELSQLPQEVQAMATSLQEILGHRVDENALAAAVLHRLRELDEGLLTLKEAWLREYETACVTVGQTVAVVKGESRRIGFALGIDENGGLRIRWENGEITVVSAGEVSVRGMYGYI